MQGGPQDLPHLYSDLNTCQSPQEAATYGGGGGAIKDRKEMGPSQTDTALQDVKGCERVHLGFLRWKKPQFHMCFHTSASIQRAPSWKGKQPPPTRKVPFASSTTLLPAGPSPVSTFPKCCSTEPGTRQQSPLSRLLTPV